MRLLTAAFLSSEEFLSHLRGSDGALFLHTRTDLRAGQEVLLEISFPGLPNRTLCRGIVVAKSAGPGAWIRFHDDDSSTRDFLVGLARGEVEVRRTAERSHDRFPAAVPVDCEVAGEDPERPEPRVSALTVDLSAGGMFVRAPAPPPVGSRVRLSLHISGRDEPETLLMRGRVVWVRNAGSAPGFAIRFDHPTDQGNRRLRSLLRRAAQSGKIAFVN